MNIFFSDDDNKLTSEIIELMERAAGIALSKEFGSDLEEVDCDINNMPIELSVSVVNYDEIQSINAEFRNIDKVTDVLSFPQFADRDDLLWDLKDLGESLKDDDDVMGTMLGDVVICYDKAISQAEEYGTGIKRELIYLFVHSIFHLLGYDHMTEEDKAIMRPKEESVMEALGL